MSERTKGGRGGALDVKGFKSENGPWTVGTNDSGNEQTLRGGSGTSQHEGGKVAGGDLKPEAVKNGYPQK